MCSNLQVQPLQRILLITILLYNLHCQCIKPGYIHCVEVYDVFKSITSCCTSTNTVCWNQAPRLWFDSNQRRTFSKMSWNLPTTLSFRCSSPFNTAFNTVVFQSESLQIIETLKLHHPTLPWQLTFIFILSPKSHLIIFFRCIGSVWLEQVWDHCSLIYYRPWSLLASLSGNSSFLKISKIYHFQWPTKSWGMQRTFRENQQSKTQQSIHFVKQQ